MGSSPHPNLPRFAGEGVLPTPLPRSGEGWGGGMTIGSLPP